MELFQPGKQWLEKVENTAASMISSRFALSEMAKEWHFFNHGAIFTYTNMEQDPVSEWYAAQPPGTKVMRQPFKKPIFEGLDKQTLPGLTWNNVVCAVTKDAWPSLFEHLGGVAILDHQTQEYFQVFSGDIEILDPVLAERYSVFQPGIPRIKITVFCIDGSKNRWEVRDNGVGSPLKFVRMPPRPEVVEMGKVVLAGDYGKLQHKDNPSFKPFQEEYDAIKLEIANRRGGQLDIEGRKGPSHRDK